MHIRPTTIRGGHRPEERHAVIGLRIGVAAGLHDRRGLHVQIHRDGLIRAEDKVAAASPLPRVDGHGFGFAEVPEFLHQDPAVTIQEAVLIAAVIIRRIDRVLIQIDLGVRTGRRKLGQIHRGQRAVPLAAGVGLGLQVVDKDQVARGHAVVGHETQAIDIIPVRRGAGAGRESRVAQSAYALRQARRGGIQRRDIKAALGIDETGLIVVRVVKASHKVVVTEIAAGILLAFRNVIVPGLIGHRVVDGRAVVLDGLPAVDRLIKEAVVRAGLGDSHDQHRAASALVVG